MRTDDLIKLLERHKGKHINYMVRGALGLYSLHNLDIVELADGRLAVSNYADNYDSHSRPGSSLLREVDAEKS